MATTIDWAGKEIFVQQSDLLQIQSTPVPIYQHDINDFRKSLADLLDDPAGMPHLDTHSHTAPVTLGGVTYARLLEIVNDYTITYLPDTPWTVNIVGGNSNIGDRKNPNAVSIQTANSAGLQDSASLQASAFQGHVTIDVINGVSGTTFPRGTQGTPSNNLYDAHEIANANGISRFLVAEDLAISAPHSLTDGFVFYAEKHSITVNIASGADVTNMAFKTINVTGVLDSNNSFVDCEVHDAVSLQANLVGCGISGTVELGGGGQSEFINCHSNVAGGGPSQTPTIDLGGSGNSLLIRDWSGGLKLTNLSDINANVSLDIDSGRVIIDPTVTAGEITVRGFAEVTDNSTGTAVVYDNTVERRVDESHKAVYNKMVTDPNTGVVTIFEDDDVTPLKSGTIYEDIAGSQPYRGQGSERRDRMT